MVIDDLADRPHDCDLLLDQTVGRTEDKYTPWVPQHCRLLIGSKYALLRPEFSALRAYSLQRRKKPRLEHILITMGGVDKHNATGKVLDVMKSGFSSSVTVSLNPEEEIIKLREKLAIISKINFDNAKDIANLLTKTKDNLMNIGISGSVFYEIDKFCQMLKRQREEDLPSKNELIDASFEWQAKILK